MDQAATSPQLGKLSTALSHAAAHLDGDSEAAAAQALGVLAIVPGQQQALLLLAGARNIADGASGVRAALEPMAAAQPNLASVQFELGLALGRLGENEPAIAALSRVVEREPNHAAAWRAFGNALARAGRTAAAGDAYARHIEASVKELKLLEGAIALAGEQPAMAENMLRECLKISPTDVSMSHRLAKVLARLSRPQDAEQVLARALEQAPGFDMARHDYAMALGQQGKWEDANTEIDILLARDPGNCTYRISKASALMNFGEYEAAAACYEALLADEPQEAAYWVSYGHVVKTLGRQNDAIAAYRKSITLKPGLGEPWWGLANLKTYRFSPAEIETMRAGLARGELSDQDRYALHFALGEALEQQKNYAESFDHYRQGNTLRRAMIDYNPGALSERVRRSRALFTRAFFEPRAKFGCPSADPIFILGVRRSGSTLIEQILSSHSAIEGTMELPDLGALADRLEREAPARGARYPELLASFGKARLKALGEEYLSRTRIQRKLGRAMFTDKMLNNFQHLGLILLILPNAKIIDARRHPLSCCFSNFKTLFVGGSGPAYDLTDIGRYYRDYVEMMAHFDAVLPGRIHRVFYENMVFEPEREIRRLLDYCGVPFEGTCLQFHETKRGVRTMSSEQVRQPINSESVEQWRPYEQWLGPLKAALGPVLDFYPAVPAF